MKRLLRVLIVGIAVAGLAGPAWADTVVLADGARISGDVVVKGSSVTVRLPMGALTLPVRRVVQVIRGGPAMPAVQAAPAPKAAPQPKAAGELPAAEGPKVAPAEPAEPGRASESPGAPAVADVLAQRMTVSFDGVPVQEVLEYIHELTNVNMALAPEVAAAQEPVHVSLKDVPVRTILQLVLEPSDLSATVRPGQILYVSRRGAGDPVVRVYPVLDLLLSFEDKVSDIGAGLDLGGGTGGGGGFGGSSTSSGGRTGGGDGGGGLNPQFQTRGSGSQLNTGRTGGGAGTGGVQLSPMMSRAENLILLIKASCGRGTWDDPYSTGLIDSASGRTPAQSQAALAPFAP